MVVQGSCLAEPNLDANAARPGRRGDRVKRRAFMTLLGGAAAWPLAARAQQPAMPVVGFLSRGTPDSAAGELAAFHQGLREAGFVEGQNVTIDYRWSGEQHDLLVALAADLVRRRVAVIATPGGTADAQAAKAATTSIPVVFTSGGDPIRLGLVTSLSHPGGNVTGVTFFSNVLAAKRLTLLRDLMPSAATIAVLMNPTNANADIDLEELQAAARTLGLQLQLLRATSEREIDAAFAAMAQNPPGALFVAADAYLTSRRDQIAKQRARFGALLGSDARDDGRRSCGWRRVSAGLSGRAGAFGGGFSTNDEGLDGERPSRGQPPRTGLARRQSGRPRTQYGIPTPAQEAVYAILKPYRTGQ